MQMGVGCQFFREKASRRCMVQCYWHYEGVGGGLISRQKALRNTWMAPYQLHRKNYNPAGVTWFVQCSTHHSYTISQYKLPRHHVVSLGMLPSVPRLHLHGHVAWSQHVSGDGGCCLSEPLTIDWRIALSLSRFVSMFFTRTNQTHPLWESTTFIWL